MFGAINTDPAPAPAKGGAQSIDFGKQGGGQGGAGRSTMIFGASGGPSAPKAGKSDATVRVGPEDLERMLKEHREQYGRGSETTPSEGSPAQPERGTQLFAMKDAVPPESVTPTGGENEANAAQARRDKTQLFAYSDSAKPPDETTDPKAEPARRDKTQLFAYSDSGNETTDPKKQQPEPARHQKTQMFALTDNAPTSPQPIPEGAKQEEPARHQKTQMFALNDAPPLAPVTEPLERVEPVKPKRSPTNSGAAANSRTMIFGGAADPSASSTPNDPLPAHRELSTDPAGADVRGALGLGPVDSSRCRATSRWR
jgi:hypothetical protein